MRDGTATIVGLLLLAVVAADSSSAARVRVSLAARPASLTVGRAWTARLAVRPSSFRGVVRVTATGPGRISVLATPPVRRRGPYRVRLVFKNTGGWILRARAAGTTSRLGTVTVAKARTPLTFTWPTSIDLQPDGSILLVENGLGRLLRLDPVTGATSVLASSLSRPFAAVLAPSGSIFISAESLLRLDGAGPPVLAAAAAAQVGPVAVAPNGDVYYSTSTRVFRLPAAGGPPIRVAGTGVEGGGGDGGPATSAQVSQPHGLAVAADGALLVCDTRNDRVRRIEPSTGTITSFAAIGQPDGIDVADDGSVYVVDAVLSRVVHLSATGSRLGFVGPRFAQPFDVAVGKRGVYVLDTGVTASLHRVAPNGKVTTVSVEHG